MNLANLAYYFVLETHKPGSLEAKLQFLDKEKEIPFALIQEKRGMYRNSSKAPLTKAFLAPFPFFTTTRERKAALSIIYQFKRINSVSYILWYSCLKNKISSFKVLNSRSLFPFFFFFLTQAVPQIEVYRGKVLEEGKETTKNKLLQCHEFIFQHYFIFSLNSLGCNVSSSAMLVLIVLNNWDFITLQGLSGAGLLEAMFGTSEPTTYWFSMLQTTQ